VTRSPAVADRVAAATAAARSVAAEHGLPVDDVALLHDGANVVLRLLPAPVVARVATLTPLLRPHPAVHFGREVELAAALVALGAAVVPPSELLPPGPHRRGDAVLSFWTAVSVLPDIPRPEQVAAALADLHGALAQVPPSGTPLDTPLADLDQFAAGAVGWGLTPGQADRLSARLAALRPRLAGEVRQLHGDAHPGNLLTTRAGLLWGDFEDTCPGPLEWDLACLRTTRRLDGRAALDAFPGAPSDDELAPWLELRRLHAAAWWAVIATGLPEMAAEARVRIAETFGG
jgi:Phosphotransferase enzyme family